MRLKSLFLRISSTISPGLAKLSVDMNEQIILRWKENDEWAHGGQNEAIW